MYGEISSAVETAGLPLSVGLARVKYEVGGAAVCMKQARMGGQ